MRTRSRVPPVPASGWSSLPSPKDVFVDEPVNRGWKDASRQTVEPLSSSKLTVTCEVSPNGNGIFSTQTLSRAPFYWAGEYALQYGVALLPNKPVDLNFGKVDLVQMAYDRSRSDLFLLDFLRTASETLRMLQKPWKFLAYCKRFGLRGHDHSRRLSALKRPLDLAGQTWLEGTYGYIPLMQDLYNIGKLCSSPGEVLAAAANLPVTTNVRQRFTRTSSYEDVDLSTSYYKSRLCVRNTQVFFGSRLLRIRWLYNPSYGAQSMAQQIASYIGLNDFGRLGYEALKFSFVADWFSSFGSRFSQNPAFNGPVMWMTHPQVLVSQSIKETCFFGQPFINNPTSTRYYRNQVVTGGSASYRKTTFSRTKTAASAIDSFQEGDGLTAYRTATGAALGLGELNRLARLFRT